MASDQSTAWQVDNAVGQLCESLQAKYINYLNRSTYDDVEVRDALGYRAERYLVATGTFVCGEWQYGDDVHVVCLTYTTERIFWEYVADSVWIPGKTNMAKDSVMELSAPAFSRASDGSHSFLSRFVTLSRKEMAGCKFYLHYCKTPTDFLPEHVKNRAIAPYEEAWDAPLAWQKNINIVRDMQKLPKYASNAVNSTLPFNEAVRNLCSWAKTHGIVGEKLHFVSNDQLMRVVFGAYRQRSVAAHAGDDVKNTPDAITKAIFEHFESLCQHIDVKAKKTYVNLEFYTPTVHQLRVKTPTGLIVTPHVTPEAVYAIVDDIRTTRQLDEEASASTKTPQGHLLHLLDDYSHYIRVDCEWFDPKHRAKFEEEVIPKNINIVAGYLYENYSPGNYQGTRVRLWSMPIEESQGSCKYAILLRTSPFPKDAAEHIRSRVESIITTLTENKLDYPATEGLISLSVHPAEELKALLLRDLAGEDATAVSLESLQISGGAVESRRFRTAHEVINRLLHDPKFAATEFDLGYHDRFDGLKWMPLEQWGKKETEEEDFIPEHRVWLVKKRNDGGMVWDREKRQDFTDCWTWNLRA